MRSRRSSALWVSSAISRSATTGFLSLSRSMVIGAPLEISRARCGEHHQLEPVRDLVDAIFNRHAGHGDPPERMQLKLKGLI
jgi:hypothetical protein